MMVSRVLVQKKGGEFVSPNSFAAWRGFTERGFATYFYEWPEIRDRTISIESSALVVGGSGVVRHVLAALGVETPAIDDLPEQLADFRGRRVWSSTWGDICGACDRGTTPIFIKPLCDPKAFPARVVSAFRDLIPMSHLPAEFAVLASEVVEFQSEWRFFVLNKEIVGTGWYQGNPLVFPDAGVVAEAVRVWGDAAPAGYGIDFGVTNDGQTLLVEVNDGFSLGCLGLRAALYSRLLEARWIELISHLQKTPENPSSNHN